MIHIYNLYDLTLAVPFVCPMLPQAPADAVPDVEIIEGPVPHSLLAPVMKDRSWQASQGVFLYRGGRRAGRFLVERGQQITLDRNPAAEDSVLCALLITSVIAALLQQRGYLVLHANVAVTSQVAVAISGEPGSGKSTTQAAMLARGCPMLSDDVTVLRLNEAGIVVALPGVPKMNLCEDAAIKMGHAIDCLQRNPLRLTKVIVPVEPNDRMTIPVTLKKIYLISTHSGKELIITNLAGFDKFAALQGCIYGPQLPEETPRLFPLVTTLMQQVDISSIQRPARGCSVNTVVEAILNG